MKTQFFNPIKALIVLSTTAICICLTSTIHAQNVGIGTTTPHPSSILDLSSDSLGFLVPSMTALQRDNIANPATGLLVFVSEDSSFYSYKGTEWMRVGADAVTNMVQDADADTRIDVESTDDEDLIRFHVDGTQYMKLDSGRLSFNNTGGSISIGEGSGYPDHGLILPNVFVGGLSGQQNTTGYANTAIGFEAFRFNETGRSNTALGFYTLRANNHGIENTAIGQSVLRRSTNGHYNTAVGFQAMEFLISGERNTAIGYKAGYQTLGNANVFVGNEAGRNESGSNKLYIENSSANSSGALIYGEFNNNILRLNGNVGVSTNPSEKLDVNGKIRMRTGAVSGYVPVSDTNGVMSWSDPHTIGLWQKSSEKIYFNTGNVGIGLTNPNAVLQVENPANETTIFRVKSNDGSARFRVEEDGEVIANERLTVDGDTRDAITIKGQDSHSFLGLSFLKSSGNYAWNMYQVPTNNNLVFANGNDADVNNLTAKLTIENSTGNVGVGVTPTEKMDVDGKMRMRTGAVNGYVPVSNANGVMTWTAPWDLGMWNKALGELYYTGNVGIGTTNPGQRLSVESAVNTNVISRFWNTSTDGNADGIIIRIGPNVNPTTTNKFIKFQDGDGTQIGDIGGNGAGSVIYGTSSDMRLKAKVESYTAGLELIEQMRPTIYERISNPGVQEIGFIAQELQQLVPHAVGGSPDLPVTQPMTVDYGRITPILVSAIQEQQALIETQQQQIDDLKKQNAKLNSHRASLESRLERLERMLLESDVKGK